MSRAVGRAAAAHMLLLSVSTHSPAQTVEEQIRQECETPAAKAAFATAWRNAFAQGATGAASKQAAYEAALPKLYEDVLASLPRCKDVLEREVGKAVARHPSALARSLEAAASNPQGIRAAEAAGVIDQVALALSNSGLLAANDTAVTLNLGAGAMMKRPKEGDVRAVYQSSGKWNNLGGTVTFGSKLPEKAISGISGLPGSDQLFDALAWDVKYRLVGDRDPRARRWNPLIAALGARGWMDAALLQQVPLGDVKALMAAMEARGVAGVENARRRIGESWQVSIKLAGQHLQSEKGKNKISFVAMADKGIGSHNLTLNASYSSVDNLSADAGKTLFKVKGFKFDGSLGGSFWKDVLVTNRGCEWALSSEASIPVDKKKVPISLKNIWKGQLALNLPVSKSAQVPLSVTFTNDPNSLQKQKYVRGFIGVTYDFGALTKLYEKGEGKAGGEKADAAAKESKPKAAPGKGAGAL